MPKRPYQVERRRLTRECIAEAAELISSSSLKGRFLEWRDTEAKGLVLRIMAQSATFYLRLRSTTVTIGTIDDTTLEDARSRAEMARFYAKGGHDPKYFLQIFDQQIVQLGDADAALDIAIDVSAPDFEEMVAKSNAKAATSWTWAQLVDAFLAEKLPELTEPWRSQYEGFLRHEGLASLREKHVCDLKKGDLEEARDAMLDPKREKRIARSTVWRLIQASKEMLSWAWGHHARKSGLENTEYPWWQSWTVKYKPGKRDHTPTLEELVRTIIIAEHHRTLSEKEHATSPGTLAALWATILLGQRLGALLLMRESRLFETEHLPPGWKVMNWSEDEMKSAVGVRLPHSLPIPPAFFEAIQPYRDEIAHKQEGASDWLFPSGRGGDHVTKSAMNRLLYRLEGKEFQQKDRSLPDREGKPGPKRHGSARPKRENLLAKYDVRAWTPHDVRRTLTSFLDDCRLGGAASAILAHRENRKDEETAKERTLPVTRIHYSRAQRLDLKAEGMTVWIEAILRTYQVEKKKLAAVFLATRKAA